MRTVQFPLLSTCYITPCCLTFASLCVWHVFECTCLCTSQRRMAGTFIYCSMSCSAKIRSHWKRSCRLDGWMGALRICLPLSTIPTLHAHAAIPGFFTWVLGIWTHVLMLVQQALLSTETYPPAPSTLAEFNLHDLSHIKIWRCRRSKNSRSRWSPYQ